MSIVRGRIFRPDGSVLVETDINLIITKTGVDAEWSGWCEIPADCRIAVADDGYRIEVDDGRSGDLAGVTVSTGSAGHRRLMFVGDGPFE